MAIIFLLSSAIGCGRNESRVVSNLNSGTETASPLIGPWSELAEGSELIKEVNTKNKLVGV